MAKSKGTSDLQRQSGLQTVQRAASVLRALSERGTDGMRLSEVASLTELHKATAFRVLSALIREGFVEQDPMKGYHLGAATWILGMAAAPRFDIRKLAARALDRIAEASGDTVFLSIRSGLEAVCIDRREGSFPIRTLTLDVGSRRPLGVGAGSLALLAFLPDEEVRQTMAANQKALRRYPRFTCDEINNLVARTRARGYSFNDGRIIPGMSAVGAASVRSPRPPHRGTELRGNHRSDGPGPPGQDRQPTSQRSENNRPAAQPPIARTKSPRYGSHAE